MPPLVPEVALPAIDSCPLSVQLESLPATVTRPVALEVAARMPSARDASARLNCQPASAGGADAELTAACPG